MRNLILILAFVAVFFAGTIAMPQYALAGVGGLDGVIAAVDALQTLIFTVADIQQTQLTDHEERISALEAGGGGLAPCDANNDGVITAAEFAVWATKFLGSPYSEILAQQDLDFVESSTPTSNLNGVIDTPDEHATLETLLGTASCLTPLIPSTSGSILGN